MFDIFGLTYWGLQARMQQSLESARVARVKQGKEKHRHNWLKHQGDESVEKPWASHVRYPCACLQSWVSGLSQKTSVCLCTRMSNMNEYEFVAGRCSIHLQQRDAGSSWRPR